MSIATEITMVDEGRVASDALYLTRSAFGDVITPHGDCIKVYKDYMYATWYQGVKFPQKSGQGVKQVSIFQSYLDCDSPSMNAA